MLKIQKNGLTGLFLHCSTGLLLFTFVTYLLSWIHLLPITIILFLFIDLYEIKTHGFGNIHFEKNEKKVLLYIFILSLIFSLSMTVTGVYNNHISYGRDDIIHLSFINELKANFPPQNPGFTGVILQGYHFLIDFLIAKTSTITQLTNEDLYFHFYPLLISLLWGLGTFVILLNWTKKQSAGLWGVLFSFFGGSFGYILLLQNHPNVNLDSVFGIDQPASALLNPPFAISVVLIFLFLSCTFFYLQSKKSQWLIPLSLCVGLITFFKVYAGMIVIGAFIVLSLYELIKKRYVIIFADIFALLLFLSTFGAFIGPGQGLIFFPMWEPHAILRANLPWVGYDFRMYTYTKLHETYKILGIEIFGLLLYFLGNLGTRIIGLCILIFVFLKNRKLPSFFSILLIMMICISILIPLFFIQSGKVFEIIQLSWYYPILVSLFAAYGTSFLFTKRFSIIIQIIFAMLLIFLTLPSAFWNFYVNIYPHLISQSESYTDSNFRTMKYVSSQGTYNDTVLQLPPAETKIADLGKWYENTLPFITAFGNKKCYVCNEGNPFPNININPRLDFIAQIITLENTSPKDKDFNKSRTKIEHMLIKNRIVYIYSNYPLTAFQNSPIIKQIYTSDNVVIYKIFTNGKKQ